MEIAQVVFIRSWY